MSSAAVRAGRAFVELYADPKGVDRGLAKAQAKLRAFGAAVNRMGTEMLTVGLAWSAPFAMATRIFVGFDDQMRTVRAVLGGTAQEMDTLTETARRLGRETVYTSAQVAGAMVALARMGFDSGQIDAAIGSMLSLARATKTELPEATTIATNTLRAFSMEADQAGRVADVLTATTNNSSQTLTDLGESMKYAAPVAEEFGMTLEETSKALGTLANFGIKGSMAGTSLRAALERLTRSEIREKIGALGVSVTDVGGNMRGFSRIMQDLARATEKMPNADRLSMFNEIFGRRAITSGLKLTTEGFEKLNVAVDAAAGTADRTAEIMNSGLGGGFRRLWSIIQDLGIAVGQALAPALIEAAESLRTLTGMTIAFVGAHTGLVVLLGQAGVALIALGAALKGLGSAIALVARSLGVLRKLLALTMAHPAMLAVAALAAAMGYLAYRSIKARMALQRLVETTRQAREAGDKQRAGDLARLAQLDALAKKQKLSASELSEAKKIAGQLEKTYGDLGIRVDELTGKVGGMAGAQEKANAAMGQARAEEIFREQRAVKEKMDRLRKDLQWYASGTGLGAVLWDRKGKDRWRIDRELAELSEQYQKLGKAYGEALTGKGLAGDRPTSKPVAARPDNRAEIMLEGNRELQRELERLTLQRIENEQQREIALIKHTYQEKIRQARKAGLDITLLEKARQLEIDAIRRRHAQRRAQEQKRIASGNESAQWEIMGLKIDLGHEGQAREMMRLRMEYAKRLKAAREQGLDTDLVTKVFRLRARLLNKDDLGGRIATQARGSFNAAHVFALGSTTMTGRIAKATEGAEKQLKRLNANQARNQPRIAP